MKKSVLSFLETLPVKELLKLRESLDQIIKSKLNGDLGRRCSKRAKIKISATANIERETEFFHKTHKITILDLSTNGLLFKTTAPVINDDILSVTFRSPYNGEQRHIDCQAVRVKETVNHANWEYEVGAKAVDKHIVRAYKDMLKNRGRF